MPRQQSRVNTEVAVVALQAELPPIEQVLNDLRSIQDLSIYGLVNEETLRQIGTLAAKGIVAAREVKKH